MNLIEFENYHHICLYLALSADLLGVEVKCVV